jgi:hypothetical protein
MIVTRAEERDGASLRAAFLPSHSARKTAADIAGSESCAKVRPHYASSSSVMADNAGYKKITSQKASHCLAG